jgi:putative ABC transport system permease protein
MFRNYLASALGNLARNRLYAAISILGLAVAFAAAILIAQYVRNEFSYDRWLPGYQQVYKLTGSLTQPGQPSTVSDAVQAPLASQLRAVMPRVIAARLMPDVVPLRHGAGDTATTERDFAWADPDIFKVFPLPTLAGDLQSLLQQPDTVVITRAVARRYFGRDLPLGDTLWVQTTTPPPPGADPRTPGTKAWHVMRVTAVLEDLPANTNLETQIFASARSAFSTPAILDARPPQYGGVSTYTFVRVDPAQTAAELQHALDVAGKPEAASFASLGGGSRWTFAALPLSQSHFVAMDLTPGEAKAVGSRSVSYAIAGVGALIVLVAAINFVTLMTARAGRRGVEVGVRKASGARRADLIIQFMGEALIQVAIATVLAMAAAAALIKPFSAFVQRELTLNFVTDPLVLLSLVGVALCIGLVAAIYPALVLSSFRPAAVLKGGVVQTTASALLRQALVVVQFAILVGLIVTTTTIYRQTMFALGQGVGGSNKLIAGIFTSCDNAFPEEVRKLPGVSGAACSSMNALNTPNAKLIAPVQVGGGRKVNFDVAAVDVGFFELYGVQPVAGRLFRADHGEDRVLEQQDTTAQPTVIINETAARNLGYPDPKAAIGKGMIWQRFVKPGPPGQPPVMVTAPSQIIGVVPDMPVTVRTPTDPFFFYVSPKRNLGVLSVKFSGEDIPGVTKAIQRAWKQTGAAAPLQLSFLSQYRLNLYLDLIIQGATIAICALLTVLIACLGLFALASYTTERRTKEIGIRKVMGASTADVVKLLVWQFTIPVLWSIVIALPIGFFAMDDWLRGFAYHAPLSLWSFVLAPVAALAIAWATVTWQSYLVARAQPAGALRYE